MIYDPKGVKHIRSEGKHICTHESLSLGLGREGLGEDVTDSSYGFYFVLTSNN